MTIATPYHPVDTMSLWWLGEPEAPTLIGHLQFVATMRGVSLRYDANWLRQGFALSEDLPLRDHAFLPSGGIILLPSGASTYYLWFGL